MNGGWCVSSPLETIDVAGGCGVDEKNGMVFHSHESLPINTDLYSWPSTAKRK